MIFVTGGTGLVGAHLLFELVKRGERVKALKRETSNTGQVKKTFSYYSEHPEELFKQIEWVSGDLLDYFSLEKLLEGVSVIYHCAAMVSFQRKDRKRMISNNVEGTSNLVNAALEKNVSKICHVSSVAALGRLQNGDPINESTNWEPSKKVSGYSESKYFSETEIWRGIQEGLDAVIVNPSIVFGPANWENGSAKMFKSIWDGLKFYTKGVTGFVGVKDVVKAMVLLMDDHNFEKCRNQRYLLNAENLSYQDVFNQIADALGKPGPKINATNFMLALAWRIAALWSVFNRKPSFITKEAVSASNSINKFDGSKISKCVDFSYLPVSEAIQQTSRFLKYDMLQTN
jgi:nucleoside-diphosphate-sugar epimerase